MKQTWREDREKEEKIKEKGLEGSRVGRPLSIPLARLHATY